MSIADIIVLLENAERLGAAVDTPEGSRVVQISETLVNQIVEALRGKTHPLEWDTVNVKGHSQ